jgi:peroxiredoxin
MPMFRFFYFILMSAPLFASGQPAASKQQPGELLIKGTLKNMAYPVPYIYVISMDGGSSDTDSTPVINNQYTVRLQPKVTTEVTLYSKSPSTPGVLDSDSGHMFTFNTEPGTVSVLSTTKLSNSKITGSKANIEYAAYEKNIQPLAESMTKLGLLYEAKKKDTDTADLTEIKRRRDSASAVFHNYIWNYLQSNPSSLLQAKLLSFYAGSLTSISFEEHIKSVEDFYEQLSRADQKSYFGKRARKRLDKLKIPVGSIAPAFIQNDTLGKAVSLTSFKGKYVLIDFWASWCLPCRNENPYVVKAFHDYKDKGFTVLGVSLDKPGEKEKWIKAIRVDGLTWTHVSDLGFWDSEVAKLYKVTSIPQNFLLDPEGKIIAKNLREEELDEVLRKFIN